MKLSFHHSKNKKNSRTASAFFHRFGRDAYIDWVVAIVFSLAMTIALVSVGVRAFFDMNSNSGNLAPMSPTQAVIFDEQSLHMVLSNYEHRATERNDLKRGYSGPGDPSEGQ